MRHFTMGMLLLAMVATSGCATMSKKECKSADWQEIGQIDGRNGLKPKGELNEYRKTCGEHGVVPDESAYMVGWTQGIVAYCTPENGYTVGRKGYSYRGVCTPDREPLFVTNYESGLRVYELEKNIAEVDHKISDLVEARRVQEECEKSWKAKPDKTKSDTSECKPSKTQVIVDLYELDALYDELKTLKRLLYKAEQVPIVRE